MKLLAADVGADAAATAAMSWLKLPCWLMFKSRRGDMSG